MNGTAHFTDMLMKMMQDVGYPASCDGVSGLMSTLLERI